MAIIKAISSGSSLKNIIDYVTKNNKTTEKLTTGIRCNSKSVYVEMMAVKELFQKSEGKQYLHFAYSFSPDESKVISPEKVLEYSKELVSGMHQFDEYQCFIAVHTDTDKLHAHIIVNSVNKETGKKIRFSAKDLQEMKDICNSISEQNGLEIPFKNENISAWNSYSFKTIKNGTSWAYRIAVAVNDARHLATSRDEFIKILTDKGIKTDWNDNRKYITFMDSYGHRIRNARIDQIFKTKTAKEDLLNEFQKNVHRGKEEGDIRDRARTQIRSGYYRASGSHNSRTGRNARKYRDENKTYAGITQEKRNNLVKEGSGAISDQISSVVNETIAEVAELTQDQKTSSESGVEVLEKAVNKTNNLLKRNKGLKI